MKLIKNASGLNMSMSRYEWIRIGMAGNWIDSPDIDSLLKDAEDIINDSPLGKRKKYSIKSVRKLHKTIDKVNCHSKTKRGIKRTFYEQLASKLTDIYDTIEYMTNSDSHPVIIEVQPTPTGDIESPKPTFQI